MYRLTLLVAERSRLSDILQRISDQNNRKGRADTCLPHIHGSAIGVLVSVHGAYCHYPFMCNSTRWFESIFQRKVYLLYVISIIVNTSGDVRYLFPLRLLSFRHLTSTPHALRLDLL
jgi:hypothetical protein